MPLRAGAVRINGWVDEHVFSEDPAFGSTTPRVISAPNGWLFLADAIDNACTPAAPPSETVAHLNELASIIATSGRRVVTMVAPDKSSVHPELLPSGLATRDCFDTYTGDLWTQLAAAAIPGFVDLRSSLVAESKRTREPLYLRKDSHWDSAGSLVAIRAAIDAFDPGLWSDSEIHFGGTGTYVGDLTGLRGHPESDTAPIYSVVRKDVHQVSDTPIDNIEGGFNRRIVNAAPPGRLIPGKTVIFLDSYGLVALPQIVSFFQDVTVMRLFDFDQTRYTSLIADADQVWIFSVERALSYRLSFEIGKPSFLAYLRANLPAHQPSR
jgi:alginate O-acetyltransferase complex protein AlgJ